MLLQCHPLCFHIFFYLSWKFFQHNAKENALCQAQHPRTLTYLVFLGTLPDGTTFDTTKNFDDPTRFTLDGVIPGWSEGIQKMRRGGKIKLTIPPDIGYGSQTLGSIPPNSTLTFEIDLVDVEQVTAARD